MTEDIERSPEKPIFKRSALRDPEYFAKYRSEIAKAMRDGRIVDDVTPPKRPQSWRFFVNNSAPALSEPVIEQPVQPSRAGSDFRGI